MQPENIEEVYARSEAIREVGVLQRDGALAAVIVPEAARIRDSGEQQVQEILRRAVEQQSNQLPTYRRIGEYVVSRQPLPRTQLGKIQRHELAQLYQKLKDGKPQGARDAHPIAPEQMLDTVGAFERVVAALSA